MRRWLIMLKISPVEAVVHFHILRSREVGRKSYRKKQVAGDKAAYLLVQLCLFVPGEEINSPAASHYGNKSLWRWRWQRCFLPRERGGRPCAVTVQRAPLSIDRCLAVWGGAGRYRGLDRWRWVGRWCLPIVRVRLVDGYTPIFTIS